MSPNGSIEVDPPTPEIVDAGDNVTFTCSADGGPNNTFLWLRSDSLNVSSSQYANLVTRLNSPPVPVDEILSGLENVTLVTGPQLDMLSVSASEDGGSYTCIVINRAGGDITNVSLYVRLRVLQQPTDALSDFSGMASFTFLAESFPLPSYQWQKYSESGFVNVESATEESLVFSPVNYEDFGTYRCVATATFANNEVTSDNVTLTGMLLDSRDN